MTNIKNLLTIITLACITWSMVQAQPPQAVATEATGAKRVFINTQLTARNLKMHFASAHYDDLMDRPIYFTLEGTNALDVSNGRGENALEFVQNILKEAVPRQCSMTLIPIEGGFIFDDYGFIELKFIHIEGDPHLLIIVIQSG